MDDAARIRQLEAELRAARAEIDASAQSLATANAREAALAETLRIIATSPNDLEKVLFGLLEHAARLCGAPYINIAYRDDLGQRQNFFRDPDGARRLPLGPWAQADEGTIRGHIGWRAMVDGRTIHVPDILAEPESEYPISLEYFRSVGQRTILAVALRRHGASFGYLSLVHRHQPRPFTDQEIALVEVFADQAVIAIENARLFEELQRSNRQTTAALEQQTATAEVLRVIASSPTDLQSVLDAVAERAVRVCDADDAQIFRLIDDVVYLVAHDGPLETPAYFRTGRPYDRTYLAGRTIADRQSIHLEDYGAVFTTEFPEYDQRNLKMGLGEMGSGSPATGRSSRCRCSARGWRSARSRCVASRSVRSPTGRSLCSRRSRIRPPSPSPIPGSTRSWSNVPLS